MLRWPCPESLGYLWNTFSRPHQHARLTKELRADLSWWTNFQNAFNSKPFFADSEPVCLDAFCTDARPVGGGGFFRGDWCYTSWAVDYPNIAWVHINLKETFTFLLPLFFCKNELRDRWIVVCVLNKGTCRNPQVKQWLRSIFWLSTTYNFRITTRFIPSKANSVVVAISRHHILDRRPISPSVQKITASLDPVLVGYVGILLHQGLQVEHHGEVGRCCWVSWGSGWCLLCRRKVWWLVVGDDDRHTGKCAPWIGCC